LRVLLISTPYPLEEMPLPPLSLSYLAGVLQKEGFQVEIVDYLVSHYRPEKLRQKLAEFRPQLVGVTSVTLNYPIASRILKLCKSTDPSIVTAIGGPHATFALEETLLTAPWIDLIAIGEGEATVVELSKAVEGGGDIHQVAGIAYADNGRIVTTQPRPLIKDINQIPMPARQFLPLARYLALGSPCTVITGRGCPFRCIFCSGSRMFGPKVRFREAGLVVDEIEHVHHDLGFKQVNIVDDTFTLNHQHASEICEEILRRNLRLPWTAFARVDTVTKELCELMRRAGCTGLLFGVESADEGILKTIKKGTSPEKIRAGVKIASDAGISSLNSFILGLPGETPETARKSMDFGQELAIDYNSKWGFHVLSPLPGTELYEKASDYGLRILSRDWRRYDANQVITESDTMSVDMAKQIMAIYDSRVEVACEDARRQAEAGDAECARTIDQQESRKFVWKLLSRDVIEGLGRLTEAKADPVRAKEELVRRVTRRLGDPAEVVQCRIDTLVTNGFLHLERGGDGLRWRWSENSRTALHI